MTKQTGEIPSYAYDGTRARSYSAAAAENLIFYAKVVARRNKRGELVAIVFRNPLGGDPMLRSMRAGQKYSVEERVGLNGARAWKHTENVVKLRRSDFSIVLADVFTDAGRNRNHQASELVPVPQDHALADSRAHPRARHRDVALAPGIGATKPLRSGAGAQ